MVKLGLLITLIGGVGSDSCHREEPPLSPDDDESQMATNARGGAENLDPNDERPDAFHVATIDSDRPEVSYAYDGQRNVPKRRRGYNDSVQTCRRDQSHMLLVRGKNRASLMFCAFGCMSFSVRTDTLVCMLLATRTDTLVCILLLATRTDTNFCMLLSVLRSRDGKELILTIRCSALPPTCPHNGRRHDLSWIDVCCCARGE